jgi:hypothetical protein
MVCARLHVICVRRSLTSSIRRSSWNAFAFDVNQQQIEAAVDAMTQRRGSNNISLVELGYINCNVDDGVSLNSIRARH